MSLIPATDRASAKKPKKHFRAQFSIADSNQLEMILHEARAHLPRRVALTVLALDSESLMRLYGASPDPLQRLADDVENLGGYVASQQEFLQMISDARDRLEALRSRIAAQAAAARSGTDGQSLARPPGDPPGTFRAGQLRQWRLARRRIGERSVQNSEIS